MQYTIRPLSDLGIDVAALPVTHAVYARDVAGLLRLIALCPTLKDAQEIATARVLNDAIDYGDARLATLVDGEWHALSEDDTAYAIADLSDEAGLLGADQPKWELHDDDSAELARDADAARFNMDTMAPHDSKA